MSNVVSQHGKILHRSDFCCVLSCGSNHSQSADGDHETIGFYMEASGNRFVTFRIFTILTCRLIILLKMREKNIVIEFDLTAVFDDKIEYDI